MRFSVVIPSWNGRELLETCLASLGQQEFRDFEIVVVDGGSTDGSVEWLRARHPDVRVVELEANRGFAAAVNRGIEVASGAAVVLLNNDTETAPGWLAALAAAMERDPNAGIFASRVLQFRDRSLIDSAGDTFRWRGPGPLRLGLVPDQIGHGEPDGTPYREPRYVISACAAAAAYRTVVFERVGSFDVRFVSYLEDVDMGVRGLYAGFRTLYVPDAVIYHMGSATADRISGVKLRLLLRNTLFVFFQYMPFRLLLRGGAFMLFWPVYYTLFARVPVRIGLAALFGFFRHIPDVIRRRREVRGGVTPGGDPLLRLISHPVASDPPEQKGS